jgi:hypothetical protein
MPLFSTGCTDETQGMHPYLVSRLALEREEEFRRRAETHRLLAEVCRTEPRWQTFLGATLRWAAHRLRPRPRFSPTRWPTGNPVSNARGL